MASKDDSNMNESDDERDLTSLTWLMELRNQNFSWTNDMKPITLNDVEKHNQNNTECAHDTGGGGQPGAFDKLNLFKYKDNCNNNSVLNNRTVRTSSNKTPITVYDKQLKETSASSDTELNATKRNAIGKSIEKSCRKMNKVVHCHQQQPQQQLLLKRATPLERYEMFVEKVKRVFVEYQKSAINYQTDTTEKPPFNYSHIIGMAMLENGRVTLQQICAWIEKKFAFFRVRKKWNNSIRHNLSLHQCFRKIDRKKFEKGKGGYWELGVDTRKCDRKRIRNRKNAQHRSKHAQQHQQQPPQTQQNQQFSTKKSNTVQETKAVVVVNQPSNQTKVAYNELQKLQTGNYYSDCASAQTNEKQEEARSAICSSALESIVNASEGHLLLDELDIQQNIDVVSCCQQSQPEQEICTTSNVTDAMNCVANVDSLQHNRQQQYQLGTIIISTPAAKYGSISNFAASTGSINCIINGECIDDKTHELKHNFIYINDNEIQTPCENIIMSPYSDKDEITENGSKHNSNCQWHANATLTPFVQYPITTTTKPVSSVLINSVEQERQNLISQTRMPNFVVEQLLQPTGLQYTFRPPLEATATTVTPTVTLNNNNVLIAEQNNQQFLTHDNIRPYIDGIEEEFQYLRSIDNNREDILDSFLDISVSDY
ncbi:uncharacterized protein LOC105218319 [Zeugodacus cucurbitae]|uniref:uncharacterized protein LOC105218319 n=1 Tax=Zeugodacus cucurbitae TaxID=28588 RepID=UPI0010A74E8A|nr:uncharacterized protein LOC105218319 [Zeugodacus cucurbitae]